MGPVGVEVLQGVGDIGVAAGELLDEANPSSGQRLALCAGGIFA